MALHPASHNRLSGLALCAGVGGLEIGLHIAEPGYRTVCFVERDSFAASVLVARMADQTLCDAPVWDDVKSFDGRPWRGKVDILSAGYPCQPFSSAGLRRGEEDPRHLWPHVARIAREIEPEWLFCENVLGHIDIGFETVASDLQGMGYSIQAGLFSAAEVGAAHWRTRLFMLAHRYRCPEREPTGDRGFNYRNCVQIGDKYKGQATGVMRGFEVLDGLVAYDQGPEPQAGAHNGIPLFAPPPFDLQAWDAALSRHPQHQPCLYGLAHGVAHRVERSSAAGNGVVSLAAAYAWGTLRAAHFATG